jgi:hypothetical protein
MWSGVRIELVTDQQALAGSPKALGISPRPYTAATGFHSLAWIATCRAALKSTARLWTLVVRDGSETVAIVPTELEHGPPSLHRRARQQLSRPRSRSRSTRADRVCARGFLAAERAIDLVDFRGLRETSPFWPRSPASTCRTGAAVPRCRPPRARSPTFVPAGTRCMPTAVAAFAGTSPEMEGAGAAWTRRFTETADPDAVAQGFDAMVGLFRGRWAGGTSRAALPESGARSTPRRRRPLAPQPDTCPCQSDARRRARRLPLRRARGRRHVELRPRT